MGRHALLQGIFPTQGLNPGLPHCRQVLYRLSPYDVHRWWRGGWAQGRQAGFGLLPPNSASPLKGGFLCPGSWGDGSWSLRHWPATWKWIEGGKILEGLLPERVKKALIVLVTWVLSTHLLILCLYLFVCQNDFLTFFSKGYRLLNKSSLVWCFYGCTVGSLYLWIPHPKIQATADWNHVGKISINY